VLAGLEPATNENVKKLMLLLVDFLNKFATIGTETMR
jgi:hypothetical protein